MSEMFKPDFENPTNTAREALNIKCFFFLKYLVKLGSEAYEKNIIKYDDRYDIVVGYYPLRPSNAASDFDLEDENRRIRVYLPTDRSGYFREPAEQAWLEDCLPEIKNGKIGNQVLSEFELTNTSFGPEGTTEADIDTETLLFPDEISGDGSERNLDVVPDQERQLFIDAQEEIDLFDENLDPVMSEKIAKVQLEQVTSWYDRLYYNFQLGTKNDLKD